MTKNDIIEQLFYSKDFNDCIKKMEPEYLREDLKAEVMLVLCEQDENFLQGLYERRQITFWVVRVVINMIKSDTSGFYRKYRQPLTTYMDKITDVIQGQSAGVLKPLLEIEWEHLAVDEKHARLKDFMCSLSWYERGLIELYMEMGNYRAIQKVTGIPHQSVWKTVTTAFNRFKNAEHVKR
jgi:hypothetical protein